MNPGKLDVFTTLTIITQLFDKLRSNSGKLYDFIPSLLLM